MKTFLPVWACCSVAAASRSPDRDIVYDWVKTHANDTFREPQGYLEYKYLVS